MTLDWIHLRDGETTTRDGQYSVTNATTWEHSRIAQQRYEAWFAGKTLGRYINKRLAINACEQHAGGQR